MNQSTINFNSRGSAGKGMGLDSNFATKSVMVNNRQSSDFNLGLG